jgi:hypothetical protein
MAKLTDAPPTAETPAKPDQERFLTPEQVGQPATEQQQAAERQRVRGDHPLPVHLGEVE